MLTMQSPQVPQIHPCNLIQCSAIRYQKSHRSRDRWDFSYPPEWKAVSLHGHTQPTQIHTTPGLILLARKYISVAVRLVGVDGVLVESTCTPAVIASYAVDVEVKIDIDEVPLRKLERMLSAFDVLL